MAFFSRIRKLWKGDEPVQAEVSPSPTPATPPVPESEAHPAADAARWRTSVEQALTGAEPRLSIWLAHLLAGVDRPGPELWERLAFLFEKLEAPDAEAQKFIDSFRGWLETMGYSRLEEFRSELQYRLALALDLEDEEDERNRLLLKLSEGLEKTRSQLTRRIDALLSLRSTFDEEFWDEFEEILIMADVGVGATLELRTRLKERLRKESEPDGERFKELLKEELASVFPSPAPVPEDVRPEVVLLVGVNGVGKTTTAAKLAYRAGMQGQKVLLAAGDTFRAAAIEQLGIWAGRVGALFHAKEIRSDPAAVAFEAMEKALAENCDMLIMDTAGRLHTKVDLMDELRKIRRVLAKKFPGAPHRTILVVDATTGQNALSQTKLFSEAVQVDEIVLTKLDGTAKGGMIIAIAMEHNIPITFVGLGEKMEDLRPFSGQDFVHALLGGGPEGDRVQGE